MLIVWYDDSPSKPVQAKIEEAIQRYRKQFGVKPNVCLINTAFLLPDECAVFTENFGLQQVLTNKNVPLNYFWLVSEV